MVVHKWSKGTDRGIIKRFVGYFGLSTVCKVAGGICGLILFHQSQYSSGLLDNISLGLLIKSVLPFLELMVTEKDPEALKRNVMKRGQRTKRWMLEKLTSARHCVRL